MGFQVRFFVLVAGFAVVSCATSPDVAALRDEPTFQAGYGDGCETATEEGKSFSTKRLRDQYEFDNDRAYRSGWRLGYLECRAQVPEPNTGGRILGEDNKF